MNVSATQSAPSDFWELIRDDPAMANARRKLSIHEFRTIMRHARVGSDTRTEQAHKTIAALIANPHGCRFCDYGKLRRPPEYPHSTPNSEHDDDCGFAMAEALTAISKAMRS